MQVQVHHLNPSLLRTCEGFMVLEVQAEPREIAKLLSFLNIRFPSIFLKEIFVVFGSRFEFLELI